MRKLRLKFSQNFFFFLVTAAFPEAKNLTVHQETKREGSVYVAAMLKSQTVWFMAAGRDRDQRTVSC